MATAILTTLSLTAALISSGEERPFYAQPSCKEALQVVMAAEAEAIEKSLSALAASDDLDDKACAVWLEQPLNEIEMSLEGNGYGLPERRKKRLLRLFKFSKVFGKRGPQYAMLEMEARMRRVRLLAKDGERMGALKEMRRVERMLDQVGSRRNPTIDYVRGVTRLAVSQAGLPLRLLLGMAGVSGDEKSGRRLLESLAKGDTVYAADALYILHHFAQENKDTKAGLRYGAMLTERYPNNPQFAYEYAKVLFRAKQFDEVLRTTARFRARLDEDPKAWSDRIRKKLYVISAKAALESGNKGDAKRWTTLASEQKYGGLKGETKALLRRL